MKTKSRTPWAVRLAALAMVAVLAVGGSADAQVRISQFYGGGGNVSATYLSDYVELYNAGTSPQSLGGWSVQYASSTGTSWTVNALPSALLQPGQYFLVKEADGTSITGNQVPALPTPDVIFAISMSATDAKVALCSTTVALIGGTPTVAANPQLVDFVGLGTLANWNEPATLGAAFSNANNAPAPSNNYAIFRRGCGYQDINNNAQDFVRGFPSPRNTATVLNNGMSGGGAAAPMYVEPMFTTRLTVTPALCGTGELPPGTTVTANLTLIGGPAAQPLNDNGILGDEQAGDGIFSYLAAIAPGTLAGTKNLPVTFGGGGGGGGAYISLVVEPATNPDNDNAATAQPIPGPPYADVAGLFTGATVEWNPIVALPTAPSNGMSYRRGLWYTVMGTGNTMTASLCQSLPSFDSVLIVMAGTPDGLTVVANGDDNGPACTGSQASASWCSLSGLTYYVWIAPYSTGAQTYAFVLRISDDGIPCATAVPISFCTLTPAPGAIVEQEPGYGPFNNDGCSEPASANRFRDIGVLGPTVVNIAGNVRVYGGNRDIDEYRFQAGLSDLLTVSITSQMSAAADIYSLSPGGVCPATLITSSGATQRCTPATASTSLTAGNWYVLRISAMPTASSASILGGDTVGATSYNYIGSLLVGGPPPNDNCSSATVIATGGTGSAGVIGNNVGATLDGAPIACGVPVAKDVWYSFQPNATASWDISTCNATDFDTVIEVLDACYGAVVACNDDALGCGDGTQSKLSVGLIGGVTYWIRVCAKLPPGTGGSFNLVVVRTPPPNDWCAGAIPIGEVVNLPFDTTVATTDGIGTHSIYKDIWYCYTPACSGTVTVDLCGSTFDTKLAVWEGCVCPPTLELAYNDDDNVVPYHCSTSSSLQSWLQFTAVAGTHYLIQVGAYSSTGGGPGDLTITCPPIYGACCLSDGECVVVTEAACLGYWYGPNTVCAPEGACCLPGNTCIVTTADCCARNGGSYVSDGSNCGGAAGNPVIYAADPNLPIPDNDPTGVSHTISVPDSFVLGDVNVDVDITHTWIGDLIITVTHGGTIVTLWSRQCSSNDNMSVVFDDEGGTVICATPTIGNILPFTGNFLSAFDGMNSSGDWTITVSDNVSGDIGTLVHWSLHLDGRTGDPCLPGACCYTFMGYPRCEVLTASQCSAIGGTYYGPNTNCGMVVEPMFPWEFYPNLPIPAGGIIEDPRTTQESTPAGQVEIDLQLLHPNLSDLRISVIHWGVEVVLWDGACPMAPVEDMDAIFSDTGGLVNCTSPVVGYINPLTTGGTRLHAFAGMEEGGPWILRILNRGLYEGTLVRWSIHIRFELPDPCWPQPIGACCVGAQCTYTYQEVCVALLNGEFLPGVLCDPNPCLPPPTGACCFHDGHCEELPQSACPTTDWRVGVPCVPNPCPRDHVVCEPQDGPQNNPLHPPTYWYDVTVGNWLGVVCDFHVQVFDPNPQHYTNVSLPPGHWHFGVHQVGNAWWASWWTPNCDSPLAPSGTTFRFQFDNTNPSAWSHWRTTYNGTSDPDDLILDRSENHATEPDGLGYRVHVPQAPAPDCWPEPYSLTCRDTPCPITGQVCLPKVIERIPPSPFFPPAGIDVLTPTGGYVEIVTPTGEMVTYTITGEPPNITEVTREEPVTVGDHREIATEITQLELFGGGGGGGGGALIHLNQAYHPSRGHVVGAASTVTDYPADSFFDLFVQIDLPGMPGAQGLWHQTGIPLAAHGITHVPPWGSAFETPLTWSGVELLTPDGTPTGFVITRVVHILPPSPPEWFVAECDCMAPTDCHLARDWNWFCAGDCPPGEMCESYMWSDPAGNEYMSCRCVPIPCEPEPGTVNCKPVPCPSPEQVCLPKQIRHNLAGDPVEWEVIECECVDPGYCHITQGFSFFDGFEDGSIADWTVTVAGNGVITPTNLISQAGQWSLEMKSLAYGDRADAVTPAVVANQLDFTQAYTVEFDFRLPDEDYHYFEVLATNKGPTLNDSQVLLVMDTPDMNELIYRAPPGVNVHVAFLNPGQWYHFLVTVRPPANQYDVLIDGGATANVANIPFALANAGFTGARLGDRNDESGGIYFDWGHAYWDNFSIAGNSIPVCAGGCPDGQMCQQIITSDPEGREVYECQCVPYVPPEACCLEPNGYCLDLTPAECLARGGTPQGPGTACAGILRACCIPDAAGGIRCVMVDPVCCDDLGGTPGFMAQCVGDLNGNGIDDACEPTPVLEPKWSQPPHGPMQGFDGASDLWWVTRGPDKSPGTKWNGHVEAHANAQQSGFNAHNPADDIRDFQVDDASPSRTWVPNGASNPPGPVTENGWDNDGAVSWHTAFSGTKPVKGQSKAKAGLAADLSGIVDARARVINTAFGDVAHGRAKATQSGPLVMIAGPLPTCTMQVTTVAYLGAPMYRGASAVTGSSTTGVVMPVGLIFGMNYEDVAEVMYPQLSPVFPIPGAHVGGALYVNDAEVTSGDVYMTQSEPGQPITLYPEGSFVGVPFAPWTAPGPQGQWYEDETGHQSYYGGVYMTVTLPEGYSFIEVDVNKVVADDFVSDGRPIRALDWHGSYLDQRYAPGGTPDPLHVLDGWFISFHHAWPDMICPPPGPLGNDPTVLAVYFAPAEAVTIMPADMTDCFQHLVYRYWVDLSRCCLLCSEPDPRLPDIWPPPGQPDGFHEVAGLHYWLDLQAVVGVTWRPQNCAWEDRILTGHVPSDLTPEGHFWGWHTSPALLCPYGGLNEACTGRVVSFAPYPPHCWWYDEWIKQPWLCPEQPQPVQMAFELLAPPCVPMGDANGDGILDMNDIGSFVQCLIQDVSPGCWCACADMNYDGDANGLDIQAFVNALLGIP